MTFRKNELLILWCRYMFLISAFVYLIFGTFCSTFSGIYELNVISYTLILDLCLGMVLWCVFQNFRSFWPSIWPSFECMLTPHGCPAWVAMPVEQEKSRRFRMQQARQSANGGCHARGTPVTANLLTFLHCAAKDAPLAILKGCFLNERRHSTSHSITHHLIHH